MRLALAILASILVVIPLYFVLVWITGDLDNDLLMVVTYVALMVSAFGVIVVGLPTHYIMRKLKKREPYFYAFPGFLVPALFVLIAHPFGEDGYPDILYQAILTGVFGLVASLVFWGIAVRGSAA